MYNKYAHSLYHPSIYQEDFMEIILANDAEKVGKHQFSQLKETHDYPQKDDIVLPINYLLSTESRSECWFHCFVDDYQFDRLYNNFNYYVPYLKEAKGFISTDYSIFRNFSEEKQIHNCRKNRVIAFAAQKAEINAVPTAGFGGENTWSWCFDGLPYNSTVAVTTNSLSNDPEAMRLFVGGIERLVKKVSPENLIVCGKVPKWLPLKYPDINVVHIPSYSEMRNNRRCK